MSKLPLHLKVWLRPSKCVDTGSKELGKKSCGMRSLQGRMGVLRGLTSALGEVGQKENTRGMGRSDAASSGTRTCGVFSQQVAEDRKFGHLLLEGFSNGWSWVTETFPSH